MHLQHILLLVPISDKSAIGTVINALKLEIIRVSYGTKADYVPGQILRRLTSGFLTYL